jgi:hypothetical protein
LPFSQRTVSPLPSLTPSPPFPHLRAFSDVQPAYPPPSPFVPSHPPSAPSCFIYVQARHSVFPDSFTSQSLTAQMDLTIIYGIIVAGLLFLFCLRGISNLAAAIIHSRQVTTFMSKHLYPYLYRRRRFLLFNLPPISRLVAVLQFLYWAITVIFNVIGASTLSEAGSRAGSIAIFNFVPLVMADRLGFMADLMDMPLRNLLHVHKSIGAMTVLQTAAHVILKCLSGEFSIHDRNGLMVRSLL